MRALRGVGLLAVALVVTACATTEPARSKDAPEKRARLNTQLAFEYAKDGKYRIAVEKLEKALEADRRYVDAHIAGGVIYSRLGEWDTAEDHYRRAVSLDDENITALNNYGLFLCSRGRHEEGLEKFERALDLPLNTNPVVTLNNAGQCAYEDARLELAEKYLREALQIDPRLSRALLTMGKLSFEYDRDLSARGYLQRFHSVAKETAESLWLGVRVELALGDRDAARGYARRLRGSFPDSLEAGELAELTLQP